MSNDFLGEWVTHRAPRTELEAILMRWREKKVTWWKLRDEALLHQANPPLTSSKDEWANAILELCHLVVEGFIVKNIRLLLYNLKVEYDEKLQSIALLEFYLTIAGDNKKDIRLSGMRELQNLRSKVKGHPGGSDAKALTAKALEEHESFKNHFENLCKTICDELTQIELALPE